MHTYRHRCETHSAPRLSREWHLRVGHHSPQSLLLRVSPIRWPPLFLQIGFCHFETFDDNLRRRYMNSSDCAEDGVQSESVTSLLLHPISEAIRRITTHRPTVERCNHSAASVGGVSCRTKPSTTAQISGGIPPNSTCSSNRSPTSSTVQTMAHRVVEGRR